MAATLPPVNTGCGSCDDTVTVAVPGPAGANGADGADGADGQNAYTSTTAQFTMPAVSATVTVAVLSSTWMAHYQVVAVGALGMVPYAYMQVTAKPDSTHVTLTNLADGADAYVNNVAPGTVFPIGTRIAPAGIQGPAGADGASGAPDSAQYYVATADGGLSAERNLGALSTGLLKITVAAGVATPSTAISGVDYYDVSNALTALDSTTPAADTIPYYTGAATATTTAFRAFGITLAGTLNQAAARTALGLDSMAYQAAGAVAITGGTIIGITTLTQLVGGTGVTDLPYISINRGGVDQGGVATATPTKVEFNNEVVDHGGYYDNLVGHAFTPLIAGAYAFTIAVTVEALVAQGDVVTVYLYKNGASIAQATAIATGAGDNVQAILNFLSVANGTTDYYQAYVMHDSGAPQTIDGTNAASFFCAHWAG